MKAMMTVMTAAPKKPSQVLLGDNLVRGRSINLRPMDIPTKYAIMSLQMIMEWGNMNQKSPW